MYEADGIMLFSGSAVQINQTQNMVLIYTGMDTNRNVQNQNLAFSTDGGFTFQKYHNNPVLDFNLANFRDPKVFWYSKDDTGYWVMAVVVSDKYKVQFYNSSDLIQWNYLSEFGNAGTLHDIWECPDVCSTLS
jgi:sucrose-6-phosphate hydrolase SacC (GH32 family)